MTFLELARALEERLGSHQLPLHPGARGLADLLDDSALHPVTMRRVLAVLYGANRCRQLADPVAPMVTLDALGNLRHEIHQSPSSDVDVCQAMDALCAVAVDLFQAGLSADPADRRAIGNDRGARVIPLRSKQRDRS